MSCTHSPDAIRPYSIRITWRMLDEWQTDWPCSTLVPGVAYFDQNHDLVDLSPGLHRAEVDGHELDALQDDWLRGRWHGGRCPIPLVTNQPSNGQ